MNVRTKSIFIFTFLTLLHNFCWGQKQLKEKVEIAFGLSSQDSIPRFHKTTSYDQQGRIVDKQYYFYHPSQHGKLIKEEKAYYDAQNKTLTERLTSYPQKGEPVGQKLVTQYLDYQVKEQDSKRISRQLYDKHGELSKEDTLTYDDNQRLIEKFNYDYRGNTSLYVHYYDYDKNGLQTRWRTYSKWTTINGKGEVADRQKKRKDWRYCYNKKGQLVASGGRHYKNRYRQKLKYDKNGKILEDYTFLRRKIPQATSKDKPKQKKYRIDKDEHILSYENGLLVSEVKKVNKQIFYNRTISYQDTLPKTVTIIKNKIKSESIDYEYNANNILAKKIENKYTNKGKLRYSITTSYNEAGKPLKEVQIMNGKTLSVLEVHYDADGNPSMQSLSSNNNRSFEKTLYIYKYY